MAVVHSRGRFAKRPYVIPAEAGASDGGTNIQSIPRSLRIAPPYAEAKGAYIYPLREASPLSFRAQPCRSERKLVIPSATLSFRAQPCHSERSEESSPFAKRKGARGMLAKSLSHIFKVTHILW